MENEKRKEQVKKYYEKNKEAILQRQREKYAADPERYIQYAINYDKKHPEKRKENAKKYYEKHKETIKIRQAEYWAKKQEGKPPRVYKNEGKANYKIIRVDGKNQMYHRWVWEQANGPIPKGLIIHHIDGDITNNDITNLMMLTRKEHNKIHKEQELVSNGEYYRETSKNWMKENKEKWNEYQLKYKAKNKTPKTSEWYKEYYAKNKEKLKAAALASYYKNHEANKERNREYQKKHRKDGADKTTSD